MNLLYDVWLSLVFQTKTQLAFELLKEYGSIIMRKILQRNYRRFRLLLKGSCKQVLMKQSKLWIFASAIK